ncbi:MAG: hypothetical protein ACOX4G_13675 [Limnochordia bacterium]
MRRLSDRIYEIAVLAYLLLNRQRIKAATCFVYMVGAVAVTLSRQRLLLWSRTWWQTSSLTTLRTLLPAKIADIGAILQRAETIFH